MKGAGKGKRINPKFAGKPGGHSLGPASAPPASSKTAPRSAYAGGKGTGKKNRPPK